jgi:hypothetical protein
MFRFPENVDTTLPTLHMANVTVAEIRGIMCPERDKPTLRHAATDTVRSEMWGVPESQETYQLHTQTAMRDRADYLSANGGLARIQELQCSNPTLSRLV